MKKILIILISTILIAGCSFILGYSFSNKKNEIPENISSIPENLESKQNLPVKETLPDKYGGEVIQVGGEGSEIHQVKAYEINELAHGYMPSGEEWVSVWFNSPSYLMNVDCREGYKMYLCKVNDVDGIIDEHPFGCTANLHELGNTTRNKVNIACAKE